MRVVPRRGHWLWACAGQLAAGAANPTPLVDYQAPEECPAAEVFEQELASRLGSGTGVALPIRVRIALTREGYRGRVEGARLVEAREVVSRNCEELTSALALVTAVALQASDEAESKRAGGTPREGELVGSESSFGQTPETVMPTRQRGSAHAAPSEYARPRWGASVGVGAGFERGSLPSAWLGPRLRLGVEFIGGGRWTAELGASATLPRSEDVNVANETASFQFAAGRADACVALQTGARWQFAGCGLFEVGRLRGASGLTSDTKSVGWWAPGLQLRAEFAAARTVWLFAQALDRWPLVRGRFAFSRPTQPPSSVSVYDIPAHAFGAELGLMMRFR